MPVGKRQDSESFFLNVYEVVRQIPRGRVTSYGAIAEYLGARSSARMVGWAMNAAHTTGGTADMRTSGRKKADPQGKAGQGPVPAHRVVNRNGLLTGRHHFGHPALMQQLLENEGIEVLDDRIVHFDRHFWDPRKELT
ncbi:MAG TPA: MGMT family protein [Bacteroidales bacterium]|nr:MGMT family protein [Bacteroidales bacterium]HPS63507.1 MGMT family protein [Bacteroidales bacterium]